MARILLIQERESKIIANTAAKEAKRLEPTQNNETKQQEAVKKVINQKQLFNCDKK